MPYLKGHHVTSKHVAPRGTKRCNRCGEFVPLSEFYKAVAKKDGLVNQCKPCFNISSREYALRRKYGITQDDVDRMVRAQGGRCAICRKRKKLHVDHCHRTGKVRGMLCGTCNRAIGMLSTVRLLNAAIQYLS